MKISAPPLGKQALRHTEIKLQIIINIDLAVLYQKSQRHVISSSDIHLMSTLKIKHRGNRLKEQPTGLMVSDQNTQRILYIMLPRMAKIKTCTS